MGAVSNYLERGKWIPFNLKQLTILSIIINFLGILTDLPIVAASRKNGLSELHGRDWDQGDIHVTSPYSSSSTTNTSARNEKSNNNNIIQQRKMHPYSTSYSIINSTKNDPEYTIDQLFRKLELSPSSTGNETNSDFYRNVEELKKVVRARQELVKRQNNPDINFRGSDNRESNSSNSKLEENINTINVLIGMLMLANSKLIEQRDKMSPSSSLKKIRDLYSNLSEDTRVRSSNKLEDSQASSPITSQAEPKVFKNSSMLPDQGNSTVLPVKIRKFKTNRKDLDLKEPSKTQNVTQRSGDMNLADHFSVKPGFDSDDVTHRINVSEKNLPSEARYSGMLFTNPALIGNRRDFFGNHKPIVAHDLLHVRAQQPDPASSAHNRHMRLDNVFFSHIPMGRQPISGIYEHPNLHRQTLDNNVDRRGLVHSLKHLPYEENHINSRDEEKQQMVPPYNVHNLEWPPSTTANPHLAHNQFDEYPNLQRLGEGYQYNQASNPTIYPVLQNNPHLNSIGDSDPRKQQFVNPLQQVLMAARNQQVAALDLERRRLIEHEMEVQRRQQQIREQHENNLMNQKLAHDERQTSAKNNENNRQQADSENQQGGPETNEDQGSQVQQDQAQGGGAQDQADDSGGGEQNSGQQGGNEGIDAREDDKDMKNFQDFAGDTDFTDLFPPGILSDAEIKEMRKQHQEQKQREQEEQEERVRQRQSSEEEQGNSEENSGKQQQAGQQENVEQTEQNDQTQDGEVQKQPESSLEEKKASILVSTNNNTYNVSSGNNMVQPQVTELKAVSQNSSSKLGDKTSLTKHDSKTTKVPRLFVPNFLNNSRLENSSIEQAENSSILNQQPIKSKGRRSHHSNSSTRVPLSQVENNELLPNGMFVLESGYQDKYLKPFMSIIEERNNIEHQQLDQTQASSTSGDEDIKSELAIDFEDQANS